MGQGGIARRWPMAFATDSSALWGNSARRATIQPMKPSSPEIEAAAEMGIDVAMLLGNLELTPAERVRRNGEAIRMLERIRRANFDER